MTRHPERGRTQKYRKRPKALPAMFTRISAAVFAMLVAMTTPLLAFSNDEKTADECGKYLTEMSNDLDT